MKDKTVAEGHVFAIFQGVIAEGFVLFALEIMDAKRIGREKTVIARVPPSLMAEVAGMLKHGDDGRFALVIGSEEGDPSGLFAPALGIFATMVVKNPTGSLNAKILPFFGEFFIRGTNQTQTAIDTESTETLFRIAEDHIAGSSGKDGGNVKSSSRFIEIRDAVDAFFAENGLVVTLPCELYREGGAFILGDDSFCGFVDDAGILVAGPSPEIVAIDGAVREPE